MIKHFISILLTTCIFQVSARTLTAVNYSDSAFKKKNYRASTTLQNDIVHTRLDVKFDWDKAQLTGKASITAKPYFKPSAKLDLNARGMNIHSVEVYDVSVKNQKPGMTNNNPEILSNNKLKSSYRYEHDSLKIDLGKEFLADEKYLVKISYTARPNELTTGGSAAINSDKGLFFINPKNEEKNKMPQIWTQGETMASSAWFPTVDTPNEKMTNEIYMTVDDKYTTLSNGLLKESKKNGDGTRTDHWKMDLPHSPYLVMMGVGEFKKVTDLPWNGKEISYYVEKEYAPYAKGIFGNTKEMISFYSEILKTPYPWQKYAQIVVRDYVSGAMENTSATLHGDFMVYQTDREMIDGKKGEDVIAHELFHQWFGDLVTAESWSNLPLNESFATYGEYLWEEYKNGRDAADAHSYKSRMGYFNEAQKKQVEMIRFEYENREDMFDAFSYNKGGQILHMLRKYVGDATFFASLKLYLEKNRFKSAEIHHLRLAFEEVTNEDLNWFFNEWFLAKGHPELEISKKYDVSGKMLTLTVKQKQDLNKTPLYTLPVDLDLYYSGKKERHRIIIDEAEQEFKIACPVNPDLVNFDAERQLLGLKTYSKSIEESFFQYQRAPLFSDRLEALNHLKGNLDRPEVYRLMLSAAENDPWWELRIKTIGILKNAGLAKETDLKPLLIKIASSDKNTNTRAFAIEALGELYHGDDLDVLYLESLKEQSYAVVSSALEAISDSATAMQKTRSFESEKNENVFSAIATVYGKYGSDKQVDYFTRAKNNFSYFGYITYIKGYASFLQRCVKPSSFETAANDFIEVIKTGNDYVSNFTKKAYKEQILDVLTAKAKAGDKVAAGEFERMKTKLEVLYKTVTPS
ncbi:MAG: M1 family aminopeptidase [Bacteroidota bacterium]